MEEAYPNKHSDGSKPETVTNVNKFCAYLRARSYKSRHYHALIVHRPDGMGWHRHATRAEICLMPNASCDYPIGKRAGKILGQLLELRKAELQIRLGENTGRSMDQNALIIII